MFRLCVRTVMVAVLASQHFRLGSSGSSATFLPTPKDTTLLPSSNYPGASISYKQTSICETTPGVNAYSGYINLPPTDDTAYNASVFFWYFEARNNASAAPVTVFIPGGPGSSFLTGASGLPCDINADSNSTTLNPWSWNNEVNMLYIDVPINTGYSFAEPVNGTWDLLTAGFTPATGDMTSLESNISSVAATISNPDPSYTQNTTAQVTRIVWKLSQVWFQEFPEYKTTNKEINFWSFSYSGYFATSIFAYFIKENGRIRNSTTDDTNAKELQLGTLGINNGCIDQLIQQPSFPEMAYNSTYDIQIISKGVYEDTKNNITKTNGCNDQILQCRAAALAGDPNGTGRNATVNKLCVAATDMCFFTVQGAYRNTSLPPRSFGDLALVSPAVFPHEYEAAFWNHRWVQEDLGAKVNMTLYSSAANGFFFGTGDPMIGSVEPIESVLTAGHNLAFVYGDRDYRCNWMGAENISLTMNYPSSDAFRSAGYTNITTNNSYTGGLVRQHRNVSFSRVFESGHGVASYQPETVYRIFNRAIFGRDIATGEVDISTETNYTSRGLSSSLGVRNVLPASKTISEPMCFLFDMVNTCTPDEIQSLANGTAVVKDYLVELIENESGGTNTTKGNDAGRLTTGWSTAIILASMTLAYMV